MDLAVLGLQVDSAPLARAAADLERVSAAASKTGAAVDAMGAQAGAAMQKVGSSARATDLMRQSLDRIEVVLREIASGVAPLNAGLQSLAANTASTARATTLMAQSLKETELAAVGFAAKVLVANDRIVSGSQKATGAVRLTGIQMQQLSYQANDVATMFLSGASPFQILATQAGQVVQILQQNDDGIIGSLKEFGGLLMELPGWAKAAGIGLSMIAVAAGAYYAFFAEETIDAEAALERHKELIREIKDLWPEAGAAMDAYFKRSPIEIAVTARLSAAEMGALSREANRNLIPELGVHSDVYGTRLLRFQPFREAIMSLREDIGDDGLADFDAFRTAIERIVATDPAGLRDLGDEVHNVASGAYDAARNLESAQAGLDGAARSAQSAALAFERYNEAVKHMAGISPSDVDPLTEANRTYDAAQRDAATISDRIHAYHQRQLVEQRIFGERAGQPRRDPREDLTSPVGAQGLDELRTAQDRFALVGLAPYATEIARINAGYDRQIELVGGNTVAVERLQEARRLDLAAAADGAVEEPLRTATLAIEQQESAVRSQAETLGGTTFEIERAARAQQMINDFMRRGVEVTPELSARVGELAARYGAAAVAGQNLTRLQAAIEAMPATQIQRAGEYQAFLNSEFDRGAISAEQMSSAWRDFSDNLDLGAIDDIAGAFDTFASSAIRNFDDIGSAFEALIGDMMDIAWQELVAGPLRDAFRGLLAPLTGASANDNKKGGGSPDFLGIVGSALAAYDAQPRGAPVIPVERAPLGGAGSAFLDLIGRAEGTDRGRGYNETLGYGAFTGGPVDLTSMTLDQVDALQRSMLDHPANTWNSSAVGRYQIVGTTLRGLRDDMGLSGDMLFDQPMQDRLALQLAGGRGPNVGGLRNEWEGLRGVAGDDILAAYTASETAISGLGNSATSAASGLGGLGSSVPSATEAITGLGKGLGDAAGGLTKFGSGLDVFGQSLGGMKTGGGGFLSSIFGGLFGGGSATSTMGTKFGVAAANGEVFDLGNVIPFARGGIVDRPTMFGMANGAGLMGEAGPEAIMPLRRGADGRLGVAAARGAAAAAQRIIVEVDVSVDDDGRLRAVARQAGREGAEEHVEVRIRQYDKGMPERVKDINANPRRR